MEFFDFKKKLSERRLKILMYSLMFGLLIIFLFSGKSNITLEAIAVSPDEQYIACFEDGIEYTIHCFHSDGSSAFDFIILPELSAGGHCTLWFENDVLCVLFYRTDKIAYFSLDGSVLSITDDITDETPPEFPSFFHHGHRYVFDGNELEVVYDKRSFLGYWFLGAERYLKITPKSGELKAVYAWSATAEQ